MSNQKIAVVTGLGLELVRQLADLNFKVVLTSRDDTKGLKAVDELHRNGLKVDYHNLDVASDKSVSKFTAFCRQKYGRVDVLVNNAGVLLDSFDPQNASILNVDINRIRDTMDVNVYGAIRMSQAIVPMMIEHNYGRIINFSSEMGQLSDMNGSFAAYRLSKTALNAVTRILAAETEGYNIQVNSICPGWVRTDMGGPNATRHVEEGVDTAIWLAQQPKNRPSGRFYRDRQEINW